MNKASLWFFFVVSLSSFYKTDFENGIGGNFLFILYNALYMTEIIYSLKINLFLVLFCLLLFVYWQKGKF